tara:strand:- start:946 stop:2667 length:1722 start_codon:yes stop_codon:yes gene_type:complete
MVGKVGKSVGGTLIDLLMGGGRSATKNLTPDIATSIAIARNALSNAAEIPLDAAQALRLGPATSSIAREAYGGSGLVRGGLMGTRDIAPVARRAPVPEFSVGPGSSAPGSSARGFSGSSPSEIISGIPVREQVRPISMPRTVRPGAAQPQAPRPEFPNNITPPQSELPPPPPMNVRPTGTMTNTVQGRLDLRNPAGSTAQQAYTTSRGVQRQAGGSTGGQMYNPQSAATPSASAQIRSMARGGGPLMDRVDSPSYLNRIPDGQLSIPSAVRRTVDTSNAAAGLVDEAFQVPAALRGVLPTNEGTFLTNLSDPRVIAALTGAGALGAGIGTGTYLRRTQQQDDRFEGQMPMSDPTDGGLPAAELEQIVRLVEEGKGIATGVTDIASSLQKELETPRGSDVKTNTPTSVISNDGNNERRREVQQGNNDLNAIIDKYTEPMSPEKYSNIADYYRDRDNYASQDSRRDLLAAAVAELSGLQSENMLKWAQNHPGLAYQLLQRQGLSAPEANQQTVSSVDVKTPVSAIGTNAEEAAYTGASSPGSSDVNLATAPYLADQKERLSPRLQQLLSLAAIQP